MNTNTKTENRKNVSIQCKLQFQIVHLQINVKKNCMMLHGPIFETVVLNEVLGDHKADKTSVIAKIYNAIVSYSTESYCVASAPADIVFRRKTEAQVDGKLKHIEIQEYTQ